MRLVEKNLSGSVAHILSIPEIIQQLDNNQTGSNIIFLGNSLTNNAIDSALVQARLSDQFSSSTQVSKITPDGTALSDWYCIYANQIQGLNSPPEFLVIGFAWAQLTDQYSINPSRLGGFFCTLSDLEHLDETGLTDHRQALRFLAGTASHVYVNREAIRNRVLDMLIPDYQAITQNLNQTENSRQSDSSTDENHYSYNVFKRLINSIKAQGTHVILIGMPVMENYELDDQIYTMVEDMDITLIDMRKTKNITADMFKDSIHLNQQGQKVFSDAIIRHIAGLKDSKF